MIKIIDNKKIDDIGEKLNVNSSEINLSKSPNWFKKHILWMINGTNFILSSLLGIIFGLTSSFPSYPYTCIFDMYKMNCGILSINIVNGIITIIPSRKNFNLNRIVRIGIVFLNLIVSITISNIIFFLIISKLTPSQNNLTEAVLYNVYKSPAIIKIQNNEKTPKKSDN